MTQDMNKEMMMELAKLIMWAKKRTITLLRNDK